MPPSNPVKKEYGKIAVMIARSSLCQQCCHRLVGKRKMEKVEIIYNQVDEAVSVMKEVKKYCTSAIEEQTWGDTTFEAVICGFKFMITS